MPHKFILSSPVKLYHSPIPSPWWTLEFVAWCFFVLECGLCLPLALFFFTMPNLSLSLYCTSFIQDTITMCSGDWRVGLSIWLVFNSILSTFVLLLLWSLSGGWTFATGASHLLQHSLIQVFYPLNMLYVVHSCISIFLLWCFWPVFALTLCWCFRLPLCGLLGLGRIICSQRC